MGHYTRMVRRFGMVLCGIGFAVCLLQCGVVATVTDADPSDESRTVSGTVSSTMGSSVASLVVRAFDRDLAGETAIGETVTNSAGSYRITYESATAIDLLIRVYQSSDVLLAESDTAFDASAEATVNVSIP